MPLMDAGIIVQEAGTDRQGVTVPDFFRLSEGGDGAQVAWYGQHYDSWASKSDLVIIGKYDAVVDMDKCGALNLAGGKNACIFATVGKDGPKCQRYSNLRMPLILRKIEDKMVARREPTGPFPGCQTEGL